MGATRTEVFTDEQNRLATMAKALGHPARIAILEHLISVNACIGNEIVESIPLSQPTISRHLGVLRDAGLIHGEIEGNHTCYCIRPEGWKLVMDKFATFFSAFSTENCC